MPAVWKADGGAGVNRGAAEQFGAAGQVVGQDTDACDVVSNRQCNSIFQFPVSKRRVEQRMIDHFGNRFVIIRTHQLTSPDSGFM